MGRESNHYNLFLWLKIEFQTPRLKKDNSGKQGYFDTPLPPKKPRDVSPEIFGIFNRKKAEISVHQGISGPECEAQ